MSAGPTLTSRIGNAVYWIGTALALLLILVAGINAAAGQYDGSILVLVMAAGAFAVGRIARQFLSGR